MCFVWFSQYTPFLPSTVFTDWCFQWKTQFSMRCELKFYTYCILILFLKAVLRQWIVGHWPRRTGCDPRPVNLRFVLDDVPLVIPFSPVNTNPSMPRSDLQPSATNVRRTRIRGPWTYKRPMFFFGGAGYWGRVGRQRTSTLLCGLQKIGKRGYFCAILNEVGVRLCCLLSDT